MARPKASAAVGRSAGKHGKVKKRKLDDALEKETGEDEFFLASDQEDNGAEEDDEVQETAEQKRLRLGGHLTPCSLSYPCGQSSL